MKRFLHKIIKYIAVFVIIIFSELVLLTAVAVIPQASIQKHVHESATYLTSKPVFYQANKQDRSSIIDRYADSILMGIAYSYNELVISSIAISIWYVPMSLEYVWNFLIMMTVSIFVILKFQKGRRDFALLFSFPKQNTGLVERPQRSPTSKNSCYFSNLMFVIASIPYIRFLVLGNHSYLHYFFTYRAQIATILCLWLALNYGIKSLKQRF